MSKKATIRDTVTVIERKNPTTGYVERINFLGSLRNKQKGWRVIS
jgi:hypothetical protein